VEVKKVDKEKRDLCVERLVAKLNETGSTAPGLPAEATSQQSPQKTSNSASHARIEASRQP